MRFKTIVTGAVLAILPSQALALDNVESAIMTCRTSANSTADQVSCLETALRTLVESTGAPDWAGKTTPPTISDSAIITVPTSGAIIAARGIGAEQVSAYREQAQSRGKVSEQSIVADFAYNQSDRLIIVLRNGQVWKQRTSDLNYVRLKKGDTPQVIVRPGALSGYRMEFPEQNQTITVSRIQ